MIGAVLAGGLGRRMGAAGGKAAVELAGRPLFHYPVAALRGAGLRVVLVTKPATALASETGIERWTEPELPRHPLTGIIHALDRADGPVFICAADMPLVTAGACRVLLDEAERVAASPDQRDEGRAERAPSAIVATAAGRLEPLFGVYLPAALDKLFSAAPDAPLRQTIAQLGPERVELDPVLVRSVNTPADLAWATRAVGGPS